MPSTGYVSVTPFPVATAFKAAVIAVVFPTGITSAFRDLASHHGKVKGRVQKRIFAQVIDLPTVGSPI